MKKIFVLALLCAFAYNASAQVTEKGDQSMVVNTGFQTDAKRFLLGVQYRYTVVDNFRIAPDLMFFLPKNKITGLDVNINLHYTLEIDDNQNAYPLIGFAMQNNHFKGLSDYSGENAGSSSYTDYGFNLGGGYSYSLNDNLFLNGEAKYMFGDQSCFVLAVGAGLKF